MQNRPILIMAGGTGGHVFPALAVAAKLQQRGCDVAWLGSTHGLEIDLVPKIKLEIAIPDNLEQKVIETIARAAKTGKVGDGKIFVSDMGSVIRIRTGETGEGAI